MAVFLSTLKDYLIEVVPFLAIGFLLSGVIHEFVPTGWVERHLGGKGMKPLLYSTLVGTALLICCLGSCLHISGDEHRRRDGTVDGGANYQLGDYSSFKEGIQCQDFGSLFGSYQRHGFGSGLVFFNDIGTKL